MLFFITLLLLQKANRDILVDLVLTRENPGFLRHDNETQASMYQLHCRSVQLLKDLRLAFSHRKHTQDYLHLTKLHRQMLNLSLIQNSLEGLIVLGISSREQEMKK